jgi:Na+/H+ antiporter NhaD/arsenite permease-like protein
VKILIVRSVPIFNLLMATPAAAAQQIEGTNLSWPLAVPFAGMLLSVALGPLVGKEWWHINYGKAAAFWSILTLYGLSTVVGASATAAGFVHSMVHDYLPFILLLFALFTTAGGILVDGRLGGSPLLNTMVLALGTMIASIIGTTGASMILIRPIIRANSDRKRKTHLVVFFIFLVSNVGGVLTPTGDPPLFLGYLEGIDFFWPMRALWPQAVFTAGVLLAIFFLIDSFLYWREESSASTQITTMALGIRGGVNIPLFAVALIAVIASGFWRPGIGYDVLGTSIELQNVIREFTMVLVGLASLWLTKPTVRAENGFEWEPIREVAYLFAGIFICIIPVMAMLHAGTKGLFAPIIGLLTRADGSPDNVIYFWVTGLLSSFLDNAPTYLVFFELAGGDPVTLMGPLAKTLTAISLGAVFMGATTYIGNAPNLMIYAIARRAGVNMPTFFPYMIWSGLILLPVFMAVTWLFMRMPAVVPTVRVATVQNHIEAAKKAPELKFYTVKRGDTLWKIAETEYGWGGKYHQIIEANKPQLSNRGKIYPGQVLRIPPLQD